MLAGLIAVGAAFGIYEVVGADRSAGVVASAPIAPPPVASEDGRADSGSRADRRADRRAGREDREVGILPLDAIVDVDGEKAPVTDGGIEIIGSLGTVHRVHITKGEDQVTEDVAVTQQGAVPAKLELKPPAPKGLKGSR